MANKPWPEDGSPVGFEHDMVEPLVSALRQAYTMTRNNRDVDIDWTGLDIGDREKAGCLTPDVRLTAEHLKYDEDEQGRTAADVIIGLAVQLGIEQGRRLFKEDMKLPLESLRIARSLMTSLIERFELPEYTDEPTN